MRRGTPTCQFDDHLVPIVHVDLGFLDRTQTNHDRFRRGPVKNGFSTVHVDLVSNVHDEHLVPTLLLPHLRLR
ncbi:hypothetical protein CsSME_00002184 [Camellia sinensis var. sinensis]